MGVGEFKSIYYKVAFFSLSCTKCCFISSAALLVVSFYFFKLPHQSYLVLCKMGPKPRKPGDKEEWGDASEERG